MKNHMAICKASVRYSQASTIGAILNAQYSRAIGEVGVREANVGVGIDGYDVGSISSFRISHLGNITTTIASVVGRVG